MSEDLPSGHTPEQDEPTIVLPAVPLDTAPEITQATEETRLGGGRGAGAPPPWELDDVEEEWQVSTPGRRIRMRVPTAVLVALLLAAGAFWGGAAVQRSDGTSSGLAGFAGVAARLGGAGGIGGASGATGSSGFAAVFGGGATSAAVGTVTDVQGSTLYITNSAGDIVKVVLSPSAKITRTATVSANGLALGDTVIVQGATAKNGTVTATSISATAAGTSASAGGGAFGTPG